MHVLRIEPTASIIDGRRGDVETLLRCTRPVTELDAHLIAEWQQASAVD